MACETITDENGNAIGFKCGSAWGLGIVTYDADDLEYGTIYGFPPRNLDPHDFQPDYECNSPEEIAAWEQAKKNCQCGREAI